MTTEEEKQAYKEKLKSIGFRPTKPKNKVTEHHTDTAIVTTTEHWNDRQDTNVNMRKPVTIGGSKVKESQE